MKKIIIHILMVCVMCFWIQTNTYASIGDIFDTDGPSTHICNDREDCGVNKWIEVVRDSIQGAEKDKKASEYIQDIVVYILGFMAVVSVLYIIYAWFNILTAAGDDEKVTQSKKTITYVALWLLVMFLSASIVGFIFGVFDWASETNEVGYEIAWE